jgi:hypothetical protein
VHDAAGATLTRAGGEVTTHLALACLESSIGDHGRNFMASKIAVKNRSQQVIGWEEAESDGTIKVYDANQRYLGHTDSRQQKTFDANGRVVAYTADPGLLLKDLR